MSARIEAVAEAVHHTTEYGDFDILVFRDPRRHDEHVVLRKGDVGMVTPTLCRIFSECTPGIVLDSAQCDCAEQLHYSLTKIAEAGRGLLLYVREEGRGHGLAIKVKALANINAGMDTFEAVEALSLPADVRDYSIAAAILRRLNVGPLRLLTNNPDKKRRLEEHGIQIVEELSIPVTPTAFSGPHLRAKQSRGHTIPIVLQESRGAQ